VTKTVCLVCLLMSLAAVSSAGAAEDGGQVEQRFGYRVLATTRTSTMERELNQAAEMGFRFQGVMGGETAFAGQEVVAIMEREVSSARYEYHLLATSKTSTMERELQAAADDGYEYRAQTVFSSLFGGQEVVVILERIRDRAPVKYEYRLLATSKTATMQKELGAAGESGFEFVGMTVAKTAAGGSEIVVITRRWK
jgi:hypothetical protein